MDVGSLCWPPDSALVRGNRTEARARDPTHSFRADHAFVFRLKSVVAGLQATRPDLSGLPATGVALVDKLRGALDLRSSDNFRAPKSERHLLPGFGSKLYFWIFDHAGISPQRSNGQEAASDPATAWLDAFNVAAQATSFPTRMLRPWLLPLQILRIQKAGKLQIGYSSSASRLRLRQVWAQATLGMRRACRQPGIPLAAAAEGSLNGEAFIPEARG